MVVARAVESSQLVANCAVWMGMLSVWPSTRSGPAGKVAASMESTGMDVARTCADPEGKKPASCSEMTKPSGVMRMVMLPGRMRPEDTCSARNFERRFSVASGDSF